MKTIHFINTIGGQQEELAALRSQFANSEQENARLKAEVEKLTFEPLSYLDDAGEWMPRHTHLAAVERLKAECQARQAENSVLAVECDSLKAEVERLRKAGDAMADEVIGCYNGEGYDPADSESLRKWNAAKEGKPSV